MSIPEKYHVEKIPSELTHPWLLEVHYAKRLPPITYAFGLYENLTLKGVVTYGRPVAHELIKSALQGQYQKQFMELNRLCVEEGLERNTLSYFVSQSLEMLPSPMVVVSYADMAQDHYGFIYQATNWIYTGLSAKNRDPFIEGMEGKHFTSIADSVVGRGAKNKSVIMRKMYGDKFYYKERSRKHRYFYFVAPPRERKKMAKLLIYPILPYPKGEAKRYSVKKIMTLKRLV